MLNRGINVIYIYMCVCGGAVWLNGAGLGRSGLGVS